jgi:hypothetical protein
MAAYGSSSELFMSKINSSELHKNENGAICFGAAIVGVVWDVRENIANLADSKKADEWAPGAIHAQRKLCEGERQCGHVYTSEVEEWRAIFRAWFERVKRFFPATHAKKFLANAESDFKVILTASEPLPEYFWRKDSEQRHILIKFPNEAAREAACQAAEEKHPVDLGGALHTYLEKCANKLVGKASATSSTVIADQEPPPPEFAPRVTRNDGSWQVSLSEFNCFDSPEDLEQDIVVTAYDVEDSVRNYIKENHAADAKVLRYDCESSLFYASTKNRAALSILLQTLLMLATDRELFAQYRVKPKRKAAKKSKK